MYDFGNWSQQIEDISTLPEFMNAEVVLYIPAHGGTYNVATGQTTGGTPAELLYAGRARVIGIRSHANNTANFDPSSLKNIRLQVPRSGITKRVPTEAKAYFTSGGRNPRLVDYVFNVNSDFNSSAVAAYTFELTTDLGAADSSRPVFP